MDGIELPDNWDEVADELVAGVEEGTEARIYQGRYGHHGPAGRSTWGEDLPPQAPQVVRWHEDEVVQDMGEGYDG